MIVPIQSALRAEDSGLSLARYAAKIGYPECAFWGVNSESDQDTGQCRHIWSKAQRDDIAQYLAEAQQEIETETGFFLSPRYVVGTLAAQPSAIDLYVDAQPYVHRLVRARWPKIIAAGVRATSVIANGAAVSHASDPAQIGPIATAVTDPDEVHIYHPGTEMEINPSSVTISGGNVTILIPRCRMVLAALADNPPEGWDYSTLANFESTVDVARVYTDPSTNAELVSRHTCSDWCWAGSCTDFSQPACIYIRDGIAGHLEVTPATYSEGAWSVGGVCRYPFRVRLNYLAGMQTLTRQAEDTIMRLAHAKMPNEPCGCDTTQRMWKRDRFIPEVLDRERLNCPFGMNDGAWIAWTFAQAMKDFTGSVL